MLKIRKRTAYATLGAPALCWLTLKQPRALPCDAGYQLCIHCGLVLPKPLFVGPYFGRIAAPLPYPPPQGAPYTAWYHLSNPGRPRAMLAPALWCALWGLEDCVPPPM